MKISTRIVTGLFFLFITVNSYCQQPPLDSLLENKVAEIPALNEKVSISVSNSSIQEFMRGVANSSGLNIDVDPDIDTRIVNNFSNVRVLDMLVFLAKEYNLKINVIGNIVTVSKEKIEPKPNVKIEYDSKNNLISLDADNEELYTVAKAITDKTGINVITGLSARGEKVSCFIKDIPFEAAIEKLAISNGMVMSKTDDGFFMIDKPVETAQQTVESDNYRQRNSSSRGRSRDNQEKNNKSGDSDYTLDIKKVQNDSILIQAENAPIDAVLKELSDNISFNYFLSPGSDEKITGTVTGKNPDEILTYLLNGTKIAQKKIDNVYIIGEKKKLDYNDHRVIQLQNRSIDKLVDVLPKDLMDGLEVAEFPELNSLFVSGPSYQIDEFQTFVKKIDKVVPVVLIEVIIMYVNKTYNVSTGIQAGLGDAPTKTSGTLFPNVDVNLGVNEINKVINGMGWVNLGNVTPNFYVSLQAMESQGLLELQSTPKLSTLNGHEATLSIGNTEYYLEERTDIIGTQNPTQTTSQEYKSVNAELKLKIKPIVSGDEQITLEIEVSQSDFTERIAKTAPPGTVNRDFTSLIRVKNKEMVLLGGLMENRTSDSGTGTPILSRIPVIKWFFSSRKHETGDSKLSVLIRPTIIN